MDKIWAPWRIKFLDAKKPKGCIFCAKSREKNDKKNYILHRGASCFVILNAYPYTSGHVMVVPYRHIDKITSLNENERREIIDLSASFTGVLKKAVKAEGFNVGFNQGKVSGAGIEKHVHMHVVPRWHGDVSYMQTLADAKVLPESLPATYTKLKKAMKGLL
ncbi:MAG: HIT domain-containing protein [Candidatus Aenigmarchaeota archaeon]|nr:HIT domain-containing protein [Candidatus Aenigmarchaeota archaeon]